MKHDEIEELRKNLRSGEVSVTFKKVDGDVRVMKCTLSEAMLPERQEDPTKNRKTPTESLAVWDLEKGGWRSFRYDSIMKWSKNA